MVDTNAVVEDISTNAFAGRTFINVCGALCEGPSASVGDSSEAPRGSALRHITVGMGKTIAFDVLDLPCHVSIVDILR